MFIQIEFSNRKRLSVITTITKTLKVLKVGAKLLERAQTDHNKYVHNLQNVDSEKDKVMLFKKTSLLFPKEEKIPYEVYAPIVMTYLDDLSL